MSNQPQQTAKRVVLGLAALCQTEKDGQPHAVFLGQVVDTACLGLLVRQKAGEFLRFAFRQTAAALADRPVHGKWDDAMDFVVHGVRAGKLCLVAITSAAFPAQTALRLLRAQLQEIQAQLPVNWANSTSDRNVVQLQQQLLAFQTDKGTSAEQLQRELEETKGMVLDNIKLLIDRQGKLDEILKDSEDLSAVAKEFAADSKKLSRCRCFGM